MKILVGHSLQLTWEKRAHTMVCIFLFVSDKKNQKQLVGKSYTFNTNVFLYNSIATEMRHSSKRTEELAR